MGVIFLALVTGGYIPADEGVASWWVIASERQTAISLGTYSGGWRLMRTLGRRIIHLDAPRGFSPRNHRSLCPVHHRGYLFHAPISTTHVITSAVHGRRCDEAPLGRSLGGRWLNSRSMGADASNGGPRGRPRVRRHPPGPAVTAGRPSRRRTQSEADAASRARRPSRCGGLLCRRQRYVVVTRARELAWSTKYRTSARTAVFVRHDRSLTYR